MGELFGSVVGKALSLIGLVGVFSVLSFFARVPDQMDAGDQLQKFADQAKVFMTAQFSSGTACGLPAGGLVAATASGVQEFGAACIGLPATWRNVNVYGQSHTLKVFSPTPGSNPAVLYGLVQTCGGDTISDTEAAKAAAQAQPDGGFLPSTNTASFVSAGGKWTVPAAPFATASCPNTAGHLAALVVLDGAQVVPPFLHRFAVGGSNEQNTMHTALRMGGNQILDAQDVQLSNGKYLSSAVMDLGLAVHGTPVNKPPSCPHGSPAIYVWPGPLSSGPSGRPLIAFLPRAVDNGSSWTIEIPVSVVNSTGTGFDTIGNPGGDAVAVYAVKCE